MNLDYNETPFTKLSEIAIPDEYNKRLVTNNPIIDNFFSGGLIPGCTFTMFSKQGLGKSSFLLQYLEMLAKQGYRTGVCSTEETVQQIAFACKRLKVENIEVANISNVDKVCEILSSYDMVVVDSFQGLTHPKFENKLRTLEKYAIEHIVTAAKSLHTTLGIILHATKTGQAKCSTVVTHSVDMTMGIENIKGTVDTARKITISKNRFGSCNEMDCHLQPTGYDFITPVETIVTQGISKREPREVTWDKILKMNEPITLANVSKLLGGNLSKAYYVLREMSTNQVIMKNGYGSQAEFTKLS